MVLVNELLPYTFLLFIVNRLSFKGCIAIIHFLEKKEKIEGVGEMPGTDSLTLTAENANGCTGTEVELDTEFLKLHKKRLIKISKSSHARAKMSLELAMPFKIFRDDTEAVNEAEIFLLPKELPVFTQALISHSILLPISFSQHMSKEHGIYCIRLKFQEPYEDFAARLCAALRKLG